MTRIIWYSNRNFWLLHEGSKHPLLCWFIPYRKRFKFVVCSCAGSLRNKRFRRVFLREKISHIFCLLHSSCSQSAENSSFSQKTTLQKRLQRRLACWWVTRRSHALVVTFLGCVGFLVLVLSSQFVTPLLDVKLTFQVHPEEDQRQPEAEQRFLMKRNRSCWWESEVQNRSWISSVNN